MRETVQAVEQWKKGLSAPPPLGTRGERGQSSPRRLDSSDEVLEQGRLAGARLSSQAHDPDIACFDGLEVLLQDSKFVLSTQEGPLQRSQSGGWRRRSSVFELRLQARNLCRA